MGVNETSDGFSAGPDIFSALLSAIIVASNTLAVVLFARNRSLRQPSNMILVSLAVSDLLTGLVSLPMFVACNIKKASAVCFASIFPVIFTSVSTVSHLVVITVDRWISVRQPLRYISIVTKDRALLAVAAIWLNAVMVTLLQFLWLDPTSFDPYEWSEDDRRSEIIYDSVCFVLFVGLPLPFMAAVYVWIFRQVRRHSQNIRQNQPIIANSAPEAYQPQRKAALIFLAMFVAYGLCWTPHFLMRICLHLSCLPSPTWAQYLFVFPRYCSSFLNPCMYILGKQDFRKVMMETCCFQSPPATLNISRRSRQFTESSV